MAPSNADLPVRPRLHRSYYVIAIPDSQDVLLYREGRGVQLKPVGGSELLSYLLDLLDGSLTVSEIVSRLGQFDSELVISSLQALQAKGLLEDNDAESASADSARSALRRLISHLAPHQIAEALEKLAEANIVIVGSGAVASLLVQMLEGCGVGQLQSVPACAVSTVPSPSEGVAAERPAVVFTKPTLPPRAPSLSRHLRTAIAGASLVVAASDYSDPDLFEVVNQACLDGSVRLLPAVLVGWEARLGPTCIPGQTACVHCASLRAKSNLSRYEEYLLYEDMMRSRPGERPFGHLPHFPAMLAGMAATEAFKVLTNLYPAMTYGRVVVMDLLMSESESHDVLRVPRCPACGRIGRREKGQPPYDSSPWFPSTADLSARPRPPGLA
jgi:bacteriocin biosynthesis cyclodehydratase domain-containing protein